MRCAVLRDDDIGIGLSARRGAIDKVILHTFRCRLHEDISPRVRVSPSPRCLLATCQYALLLNWRVRPLPSSKARVQATNARIFRPIARVAFSRRRYLFRHDFMISDDDDFDFDFMTRRWRGDLLFLRPILLFRGFCWLRYGMRDTCASRAAAFLVSSARWSQSATRLR